MDCDRVASPWHIAHNPQGCSQTGFAGIVEVIEFLAKLPTPEEILALRPSETLQAQITALLDKNRSEGLTSNEELAGEQYQ